MKSNSLALLIAGLGLGWLVGLSLSPVVSTVLTSLLGLVTGLVAGLSVISTEKVKVYHIWPMTFLIVGIAIGASAGNLARSNDVLGDMDPEEAADGADPVSPADRTGLFAVSVEECERLRGTSDPNLKAALATSHEPMAKRAAEVFGSDIPGMRKAVELLCES